MPTVTPSAAFDSYATDTGSFDTSSSSLYLGTNSAFTNAQFAVLFENVQIDRGATVDSAPFTVNRQDTFSNSGWVLNFDVGLADVANAPQPSSSADQRGRIMTPVKVTGSFDINTPAGPKTFDLKGPLQRLVNFANWQPGNSVLILIRATGGGGGGGSGAASGRRAAFTSLQSSNPPSLSVAWSLPTITAQMLSGRTRTRKTVMIVSNEPPEPAPPIAADIVSGRTRTRKTVMVGGRGDLNKHTPMRVERLGTTSHAFISESGELLPFAARFDKTIGGVQAEMLGSVDEVWYPAAKRLTRTPEALTISAFLEDGADSGRFVRLLPSARQLVMPDGTVWGLDSAQETATPIAQRVDLVARPTAAYPKHSLLGGTIAAAFETESSTPELPVYAIDPAGGITAPVLATQWDTGKVAFAVRIGERTRQSLWALGTPIDGAGDAPEGSLSVSWQKNALVTHLRGETFRLREQFLGPFGAVLACVLRWTRYSSTLTTCSALGLRTWQLPIGVPTPLSAPQQSAGVRADGVGSGSFIAFGKPFLSIYAGHERAAEGDARKLYAALTDPGRSWVVRPPDVSLEMSRTDAKALELAPGESVTFDLAVRRVGGYSGPLEFSATADTLLPSYTVTQDGDIDTYTVTLTAPVGTPETAYTFRAEVKAAGADNEGSILKDVRDAYNAVAQVAAGPALAPNTTGLYTALDATQKRDAEMLMDSSSNGNTLFWEGYARPNREFTALLSPGVYGAHVRSGTLSNPAQAQRMGGNQTYCFIFSEVGKTKDGCMFHVRAESGDNGVQLRRSGNGFKLRTQNGGSTVTSPDTLTWRSGRFRPILIIDTTTVTLLDRDSGSSISLARPAWADDGVRTHVGAVRANSGATSDLTRTYLYTYSVHPYALSDIARRRNMDFIQQYAPLSDGKGEYPDNAIIIALWDDNAKYRNLAAPALGITLIPSGTVNSIPGGIATTGNDTHVYANTGIPSSQVVTLLTRILDFNSGVAYAAQIGWADSAANAANATLTKHGSGQAFVMEGLDTLSHTYKTVGSKVPAGKSMFKMRLYNSGKSHELTELQGNEKGAVTGNVNWTGNLVLAFGLIKRSGGGFQDKTATKNLATVMVRGELSADDLVTTKALMIGND